MRWPPQPGAERGSDRGHRGLLHVNPLRVLLFGRPIPTERQEHARLRKLLALPVFSSDAISSVAYATQEILYVLGAAGLWHLAHAADYRRYTLGITAAIITLLAVVVTSYRQTIFAYPSGGGSYIVSRDNLGRAAGLVAAAALLIDYVLTVAVSIASGVQNIVTTPFAAGLGLSSHSVSLCVLLIALIAYANLRGLRESGTIFAIPTYLFVATTMLLIGLGLLGPALGWTLDMGGLNAEYERALASGPDAGPTAGLAGLALLGLLLHAFANGCTAMTGTEAVSNGIPAFRRPESRNAAMTLVAMAVILAVLFIGIALLATRLHVVYLHYGHHTSPAVIEQISGAVFGRSGATWRVALYYTMQISTMLVLVVAANTAFADFPRLAAILSRDRFLPRQLGNVGDKFVFSNGIVLLGLCAIALVIAMRASVEHLIPLYAVGVFTAFTLSQSGMVRHWCRVRGPGWHGKAGLNGFGAACTAIVLSIIAWVKFAEGAWVVVVVAAVVVALFTAISRHYERLRRSLSIAGYAPDSTPFSNTVLLLVPTLHRGVFPALNYARSLSPDCRAIHVETDPEGTPRLRREWEQYVGEEPPLVILPSPYRSLIGPLVSYLREVQAERANHTVTVVVPEFAPGRWWHAFLHNANGLLVKYYVGGMPGVVVSNVRYFLMDAGEPAGAAGAIRPGSGNG